MPSNRVNAGWVTYYTTHLHDNSIPPHAELPLADVLAAAEEYAHTDQCPTCMEWIPEAA
ncbi:MAG TPA: Imm1 family immunity protein [Pseudonocardiaceae bacterium]|nr:Imm1 family immunity protein [Pseudonocardiaceae bacterium]